jgi:hypothetical protein
MCLLVEGDIVLRFRGVAAACEEPVVDECQQDLWCHVAMQYLSPYRSTLQILCVAGKPREDEWLLEALKNSNTSRVPIM